MTATGMGMDMGMITDTGTDMGSFITKQSLSFPEFLRPIIKFFFLFSFRFHCLVWWILVFFFFFSCFFQSCSEAVLSLIFFCLGQHSTSSHKFFDVDVDLYPIHSSFAIDLIQLICCLLFVCCFVVCYYSFFSSFFECIKKREQKIKKIMKKKEERSRRREKREGKLIYSEGAEET